MRRGLAAVVAVLAVLAGCGGAEEPESGVAGVQTEAPAGFATAAELAWLRRFSDWVFQFGRQAGRLAAYESGPGFADAAAGDEGELDRYERLLEPFRSCEDGLAEDVGPAPTERLKEVERRLVEGCRLYQGGIEHLLEALETGDRGLAQRARYELEEGNAKLGVAAGLLPPGEKQALPVARGPGGKSRIDPRYGEIASAVAEKEVEARCWSRRDWARLMVEERILTRGQVDGGMIAFASPGGERINLGPYVCRHLDALVYGRERPSSFRGRLALAQGLGALVHESRHAAGVGDEATTECQALQRLVQAVDVAGVERAFGRRLVEAAWESYPTLPAEYVSPECRAGGKLDESPGDGRFP